MGQARVVIRVAAATFLIGCALWFLVFPGVLVHRDMVVVNSPALSAWNFGTAPGVAARNAPQDGVLALAGLVLPASWLARFILVASAIAGCVAATKNAKSLTGEVAAMAVLMWNPFAVERLLQGHWTVVAAFWLLPLVAYLGHLPGAQAIAMWAASLTPTGCLAAATTGLVTSTNRRFTAVFSLGLSLPWLVPSLIHRPVGSATDVFRPSSVLELVGLGGMWNSEVTPEIYVPLAGLALAAFLLTARAEKYLLALAAVGFALALSSLLPLGGLYATVPGLGLLRDGQKWLLLAAPALTQLAGSVRWPAVAIALTVLQVPSLPADVGALRPVAEQHSWYTATAPVDTMTLIDGHPALNPALKASSIPPSGELVVGGETVEEAAPAPRPTRGDWWMGLGLTSWWICLGTAVASLRKLSR
ncbi:hypothetical protein HMPREF1219_01595 [Corynebacterium pyruviciproducens ATCC BAA-1742]|uniref:Glycosyltransferase RgtA/B/C/D-like domain-containing protein n=1 Tax=Corynebacterium pyruviciproducens ATCC BAA-1742 TaxID=1125779 RepID=S2ZWI9_9CORY|nr:hypothetical protein [Corynebacterium pyruviciproducens]EPD68414.1 hypothetical protein HMPREF1219_01595 [Corynebacterium pyruviciproducens ATCC BAA-1742]